MKPFVSLLLLLVLSVIYVGPVAAQRPNIILIIADDMGWDATSVYGHPTARTPGLQRLANEGIRFDRAFVTTSSCSPSRSSIITGRYPHNTGAEQLHWPLPAGQTTFVELLQEAGYWTAAAGKWHLGDEIRDRFDVIKEGKPSAGKQSGQSPNDTMPGGGDSSGAEEWVDLLRERPVDQPFFLWLASFDPHRPYAPNAIADPYRPQDVFVPPYLPDTPEVRADLALYYDEVTRLDMYVGRVLDELERQDIAENTLVLFISDNGMPFPRAKTSVYDSGIRTPFIARWPRRIRPGSVSAALVSTVDLAPTFTEIAGLTRPPAFQGSSLTPLLYGGSQPVRNFVFAEKNWHDFDDRVRAVRSDRYKYIRNDYLDITNSPPADALRSPTFADMRRLRDEGALTEAQRAIFLLPRPREELYDLWEDPEEVHNLAGDAFYLSVLERLRGELDRWQRQTGDIMPAQRTPDEFDRETGVKLPNQKLPRTPPKP